MFKDSLTVKDLKEILSDLPDDLPIIIQAVNRQYNLISTLEDFSIKVEEPLGALHKTAIQNLCIKGNSDKLGTFWNNWVNEHARLRSIAYEVQNIIHDELAEYFDTDYN